MTNATWSQYYTAIRCICVVNKIAIHVCIHVTINLIFRYHINKSRKCVIAILLHNNRRAVRWATRVLSTWTTKTWSSRLQRPLRPRCTRSSHPMWARRREGPDHVSLFSKRVFGREGVSIHLTVIKDGTRAVSCWGVKIGGVWLFFEIIKWRSDDVNNYHYHSYRNIEMKLPVYTRMVGANMWANALLLLTPI